MIRSFGVIPNSHTDAIVDNTDNEHVINNRITLGSNKTAKIIGSIIENIMTFPIGIINCDRIARYEKHSVVLAITIRWHKTIPPIIT